MCILDSFQVTQCVFLVQPPPSARACLPVCHDPCTSTAATRTNRQRDPEPLEFDDAQADRSRSFGQVCMCMHARWPDLLNKTLNTKCSHFSHHRNHNNTKRNSAPSDRHVCVCVCVKATRDASACAAASGPTTSNQRACASPLCPPPICHLDRDPFCRCRCRNALPISSAPCSRFPRPPPSPLPCDILPPLPPHT